MAAELDELVDGFRNRPLDRCLYTFVWIDALTQEVREGGRTINVHACSPPASTPTGAGKSSAST